MKKLFFSFLGVLIVVILTTSCNQKSHRLQPDIKISLKADTLIYQKIPVTAPRYSCETGDRLSQDKLVAIDSVPVIISLSKDTVISGKNLPAVVPPVKPVKTKKSGAGFNFDWFWPIINSILAALLILLALGLLAYLVLWLLKQLRNQTEDNNPNGRAGHATQVIPVVPVTPGGGQNQQQVAQPNQTNVFNHQISMAEGLIGNQKIHRIIQKSEGSADGSWRSEITIETKNEQEK
ncbi:TPA: hypothetical protein DIC38_00875 [Candidatus Nomurabacteria bacterium]|nr:MAG: hypothetical protein O210_OD1C00001G0553 [Parcubacteria bacterium RAAC4_OD1_1]HCY26225.1 hypothetical protein [Candidatus Nomurabacteria bacterium]